MSEEKKPFHEVILERITKEAIRISPRNICNIMAQDVYPIQGSIMILSSILEKSILPEEHVSFIVESLKKIAEEISKADSTSRSVKEHLKQLASSIEEQIVVKTK